MIFGNFFVGKGKSVPNHPAPPGVRYNLLQENGFALLLENGNNIELET